MQGSPGAAVAAMTLTCLINLFFMQCLHISLHGRVVCHAEEVDDCKNVPETVVDYSTFIAGMFAVII